MTMFVLNIMGSNTRNLKDMGKFILIHVSMATVGNAGPGK